MLPARPPLSLDLPSVTLCCADTRNPEQAVYALRQCMRHIRFGKVLLFGTERARRVDLQGIELTVIPEMLSIENYSRFMFSGLLPFITTDHVLIVQWDGFVVHADLWQDTYLQCDYIGAPWFSGRTPGKVGNGGFSLRSRRLLAALATLPYDGKEAEDVAICVTQRSLLEREHGVRFASLPVAESFAVETGQYRPSFGFHSMHNFAHVMTHAQLVEWLASVPAEILLSRNTRKLIKALMDVGDFVTARELIRRRSKHLGWTVDQLNLYLRIAVRQVLRFFRTNGA